MADTEAVTVTVTEYDGVELVEGVNVGDLLLEYVVEAVTVTDFVVVTVSELDWLMDNDLVGVLEMENECVGDTEIVRLRLDVREVEDV